MTNRQSPWTADEVKARLGSLDLSQVQRGQEPVISGYHVAASVRSFFDPNELEPIGQANDADFKQLLRDSTVVSKPDGSSAWALRPKAREQTLQFLAREGSLEKIANRILTAPETDTFQEMLGMYLQERAPGLEDQTLDQLTSSQEVLRLLNQEEVRKSLPAGVLSALPDAKKLPERIALERLLKPFRDLAGRHFRGREAELEKLRNYVEYFGPSSMFESVRRRARDIFDLNEKPPLLITGPGGIGKSTLIAKFILDHLDASLAVEGSERLLFGYLDLDRPDLNADRPVSLLIGILEQLGTLVPRMREECEEMIDELSVGDLEEARGAILPVEVFERFIQLVRAAAGGVNAPVFLLVFDNFEEVQYRSVEDVELLWLFLGQLQKAFPKLRTVLAGRSRLSGFTNEPIELKDFGKEAAEGYLMSRGIDDAVAAKEIVERVGGNPLSLRLAVELVRKEGIGSIKDVNLRRFFLFKLSNVLIQGQLYQRILEHIHNPKVRKLAHPGMVVRRVTPEIIFKVLSGPCEVEMEGTDEARRLFVELKRESSLVREAPGSGPEEFELRGDVREMMLQQLIVDQPAKVKNIHENAVAYYANFGDVTSRAEEIYHRVALGQTEGRVVSLFIPGVEERLRNAVREMPRAAQPFLASRVGVEIDADLWRDADLQSWEIQAAARIERLLASSRHAEAMKVLTERKERSTRSPLFRVEALTYERAADLDGKQRETLLLQARNAISQSLPSWTSEEATDELLLDKLVIAARLDAAIGSKARPEDLLEEFRSIWKLYPGDPRVIRLGLHRLKLLESMGDEARETTYVLRSEMMRCAAAISQEKLSFDTRALFDFGVEFVSTAPEAVLALVREIGIGRMFASDQWEEIRKLAEKSLPFLAVGGVALRALASATGKRFPAWADFLVLQVLRRARGTEADMPVLSSKLLAIETEPVVTSTRSGSPLQVGLGVFGEDSIVEVAEEKPKSRKLK